VVAGSELVALEKEGLEETARIPIEEACSVAVDRHRVFVIGTEPLLTEVDATTHRASRMITDANSECGDIHVAFGSIWLSDNVATSSIACPCSPSESRVLEALWWAASEEFAGGTSTSIRSLDARTGCSCEPNTRARPGVARRQRR
jgi:hypothetical protein